ncbi:MAG: FadR/GntR family transcriptional regulator [Acetobacteraceae bacterium]
MGGTTLSIVRPQEVGARGVDTIFAFLREQLLSGAIRAGDRLLSERDLAIQLGVSRPVLREALRALAVLGVVEIRRGMGTVVKTPGVGVLGDVFSFVLAHASDVVEDVMEARIAIECQAARLACVRGTVADAERLRAALDRIVVTIDDPVSGGLADHAFHRALVEAGRSNTLTTLYNTLDGLLVRSHRDRRTLLSTPQEGRDYLIRHHRLIFDTFIERRADRIDDVLREHFAIGNEFRRRGLSDGPMKAPPTPFERDAATPTGLEIAE